MIEMRWKVTGHYVSEPEHPGSPFSGSVAKLVGTRTLQTRVVHGSTLEGTVASEWVDVPEVQVEG